MQLFRKSPYECAEGEPILLISDMLYPGSRMVGTCCVWTHPANGLDFWFERRSVPAGGGFSAIAWVRIR
ncbi:MAG: hypothetical protein EOP88_03460 [Verrucomicrobiaceae bacterium]|nr:MAG: hypothetical protein EOP88_03460 [Verrucomicrobiaceae bacterium]